MAKAVNWPAKFLDEVINEDTDNPKIAMRLGNLYFDNSYYVKGEIVDIRVDHKVVRKAEIIEDLKLVSIKDLSDDILSLYKSGLKQKSDVINFLSNNYNQPVNEDTLVTIITYRNLSDQESNEVDDPHM